MVNKILLKGIKYLIKFICQWLPPTLIGVS